MKLNKPIFLANIIFILLFYNNLYSQYSITGTVVSDKEEILSIYRVFGEKRFLVVTDTTDDLGNYHFELPADLSPGMLILMNNERKSFKLIFNHESLQLGIIDFNQTDDFHFRGSIENEIWYDYERLKVDVERKTELIFPILINYPQNTTFYNSSEKEYKRLENQLQNFIFKTQKDFPDAYATKLIKTDASPFLPENYTYLERNEYIKKHFLDSIDFSDTTLLNSDILTKKMIDFISLYQDENLNMNELQKSFILAIDQILEKAALNEKIYIFTLEFFLEGFTEMGLNQVTEYLSELPHLANDCLSTISLQRIEQIVNPFRKVMNGNPAPVLIGKLITGDDFNLDSIHDSRIIIVFWSAFCPHCIDLLPKINQLKTQYSDIQIVSVIIDNNSKAATEFINQNKLDFYHLFDGLAWESPYTQLYKVYGTPSIFLLDKNHIILGKPIDMKELIIMLND
jgi:thiol-disulfide isomerase/thioredoxin